MGKEKEVLWSDSLWTKRSVSTMVFKRECGMRDEDYIRKLTRTGESTVLLVRKAPQGISNRKGRLGIFPASFNPPTMAHLALIKEAKKGGHLDELLVLLDMAAMDKEPADAKFEDRLHMVKMVFQKDPKISIGLSNRGLFLEKLKPLRKWYPSSVEFVFIVGFDTILRVMDGKYYRNRDRELAQLFDECRFLVANRGDQGRKAVEKLFSERGNKRYESRISFFTLPKRFSSLSSSVFRKMVAEGLPAKNVTPAPVARFIKKRGLYLFAEGNDLIS